MLSFILYTCSRFWLLLVVCLLDCTSRRNNTQQPLQLLLLACWPVVVATMMMTHGFLFKNYRINECFLFVICIFVFSFNNIQQSTFNNNQHSTDDHILFLFSKLNQESMKQFLFWMLHSYRSYTG
mmetsp:Transcript_12237/g.18636  ORF Transcript_12237/g.18636 Transcript_12237/m.18636 type:complete len:125 (-) Transcript_12237:740-1114(-)